MYFYLLMNKDFIYLFIYYQPLSKQTKDINGDLTFTWIIMQFLLITY